MMMNDHKIFWMVFLLVLIRDQSIITLAQPDFSITDPETSTSSSLTRQSTAEITNTFQSTSAPTTSTSTVFPIIRTRRVTTSPLITTVGPSLIDANNETHVDNTTTNSPHANGNGNSHELSLKACCGNQCTTFDNLMSMVGLQCCGETPMNAFEKICCQNQIHLRHAGAKYFDRCCADKPYAWDQVCCRGKVYDGVPQASCCGDVPYSIYDRTAICCGEQMHKIPPNTGSAVCCGESMYDDRAGTHFCCGDRLYSRQTHNGCCHPYPGIGVEYPSINTLIHPPPPPLPPMLPIPPPPPMLNIRNVPPPTMIKFNLNGPGRQSIIQKQAEGYNSTSQMCCDRVYDRREYDFCCYVADVNAKQWTPPMPRPYNSKTHCCDGMSVLEMDKENKKCLK